MKCNVKICGITNTSDALKAESCSASALGYIFYPKSPRYIRPEDAGAISSELGPFVARVGVFVDEKIETILDTIDKAALTAVQLHGSESPSIIAELSHVKVIKGFRVGQDFDISALEKYKDATWLLDTYSKDAYGGTGKTFDWAVASRASRLGRVILAGGLNETNVADAIASANPWGIDVSSGIEISPGVKDHEKMKALFEAVITLP